MQRHLHISRRWLARVAVSATALVPVAGLGQGMPLALDPAPQFGDTVEVFTTAGMPVTNVPPGTAVIELDAPARLDAGLSEGLPADLAAAEAVMRERMQSPEWHDALQRYGELHVGVARAWMLRVEKVPAVVVDGEYVVYGQPDVSAAVAEIQDARGEGTR